jgi:hypothetical protein
MKVFQLAAPVLLLVGGLARASASEHDVSLVKVCTLLKHPLPQWQLRTMGSQLLHEHSSVVAGSSAMMALSTAVSSSTLHIYLCGV